MKDKKKPRTVGRLYGTGDAVIIKYMLIIASPGEKIKG